MEKGFPLNESNRDRERWTDHLRDDGGKWNFFFFFKIKKIWKLRGFCFLNLNFSGSGQVSLFGVDTS